LGGGDRAQAQGIWALTLEMPLLTICEGREDNHAP
jgi:hypothetical protein